MKKLILFSLIMTASLFAYAQRGGGDPEAKIQKRVDRMTEQLDLSADQQVQVKELFTAQQKNRKMNGKKGKEMSDEERAAMKAERKAVKADFDTKLAAILTAEQQETYKNLPKRNGKKGARKGNKMHKGKKGMNKKSSAERTQHKVAKLTEQLDLTATQQTQLTELMSSQDQARKKDGKKGKELSTEERATMKAERKAHREAYNAKFEEILTPEQLAKYQELKTERKEKGKKKREHKERKDK